jgi:hypothetical protein
VLAGGVLGRRGVLLAGGVRGRGLGLVLRRRDREQQDGAEQSGEPPHVEAPRGIERTTRRSSRAVSST